MITPAELIRLAQTNAEAQDMRLVSALDELTRQTHAKQYTHVISSITDCLKEVRGCKDRLADHAHQMTSSIEESTP